MAGNQVVTPDTTLTYSTSLGLDQTAWDRVAYFALREPILFDDFATEGPTKQSMPGSVVTFRFVTDLAAATTPLDERSDLDAVIPSSTTLSITLAEYGNVIKDTKFAHATGYIPLDPITAELIGYNMGDTQDQLAADVLHAGTTVEYGGDATTRGGVGTGLVAGDELTASLVRKQKARLRGSSVMPLKGGYYVSTIHPDVALDLREETGDANWRAPHNYAQPNEIWTGEVGVFEGFRFVETARAGLITDGGDGNVDAYQTLFLGKQCLAKAFPIVAGFGPRPKVVPGPVTDHLRRFVPMGWHWIGAYKIFRQEAVRRVETASSIGANT